MLHEPAAPAGRDPAFLYKRRLGVLYFLIYSIVYVGFVIVNLVSPTLMAAPVLGGLNFAVVYGFGLIILAFVLALAYNRSCGRKETELAETPDGGN